jgi:hypothetical protein
MKVYLSGPMSGYPDHNYPAFHEAALRLRKLGYTVVNPAEFLVNEGKTWEACLRYDLDQLLNCGAVATLDGWQESRGARLEVHVATELGMSVKPASEWGP